MSGGRKAIFMKRQFMAFPAIPAVALALLFGGPALPSQVVRAGMPGDDAAEAGDAARTPEKTAAGTAPLKDYARGFDQLIKLGLPDAARCEYVNLSAGYDESLSRLYELRLAGNSWMIEETPKVKGRFIQNGKRVVEVYDSNALMKERQKRMDEVLKTNKNATAAAVFGDDDDDRVTGQWKKVDAKKDVDKILVFLRKTEDKGGRHDSWSYSGVYGTVFIFAAQFYRKGYTNEANELVTLLFQRAGDPKKVISQAVDRIAESRYEEIYRAFRKDQDWQTYGKGVDSLIARFGSSWQKTPGAKRLAEEIKKRMTTDKAPEIAGEGLTAEDKALAEELAGTKAGRSRGMAYDGYYGYGGIWVLHDTSAARPALPPGQMTNETVFAKIRKRGMKSVPLLLAMLKDDYLTNLDRGDIDGRSYHYSQGYYSEGRGAQTEEMAKMIYQSMDRPVSRAEIAESLLNPLPLREKSEGRSRRGDSEDSQGDLAEYGRQWYDENKNKTPIELARLYIDKGDQQQQSSAQAYLQKNGMEADFELIEKKYLDSTDPNNMYNVRQYVAQRGEKAKAFIEKLEAKFAEPAAKKDDSDLFADKGDGAGSRMKVEIEALKELISTSSLESVLEEIVSGKSTTDRRSSEIYRKIPKEKPGKALSLLLDAALKVGEASVASDLVGLTRGIRTRPAWREPFEIVDASMEQSGAGGVKEDEGLKVATHAEKWGKLLADTRKAGTGMQGMNSTVGDSAATAIITLYGKRDQGRIYDYYGRSRSVYLGRRTMVQNRTYAKALLEDKPDAQPQETPAWKDITADIQKAAAAKIMNTPEPALQQTVAGLSNEELMGILKKSMKDKVLNAKLASVANRIESVEVDESLAAEMKDLAAAKGQKVSRPIVEKAFNACRKLVVADKVITCTFIRQGALDGVDMRIAEIRKDGKEYMGLVKGGTLRKSDAAEIQAAIADGGTHASALWFLGARSPAAAPDTPAGTPAERLADETAAGVEADIAKRLVGEQDAFWKAVDKFSSGEENVIRSGAISILCKPVLKELPVDKSATNNTENVQIRYGSGRFGFDSDGIPPPVYYDEEY
ncbi:MAG: hypothetical protein C0404_12330 [Verrucomicrobia bacterium]|nr:hypothetical protein [Verrucomicrobiota bacterium]